MKTDFINNILMTVPKLQGNCLRILFCLMGHSGSCVTSISRQTNIKKTHVSENCKKMYELGILNRYEEVVGGIKYVRYFINYHYKSSTFNRLTL